MFSLPDMAEREDNMKELSKEFILEMLLNEKLWSVGDYTEFSFNDWNLMLRKEEETYNPFTVVLDGLNMNGCGSWGRRYINTEAALLHILNHFNENANIKNRYKTLNDALFDSKGEIKDK
jgi:hypothetical protein